MATRSLVVGGTGGIGYAIACQLAAASTSSTVIISGRTEPKSLPHTNIEFRPLDASSMRSIKRYTDNYKSAKEQHLDLLVLTPGIISMAGRTETPEGIDRKMALHYYGRQLLIRELSPVLKDDAKVLIVLDSTRGNPNQLKWDDLDLKSSFTLAAVTQHCVTMTDAMIQAHAAEQKHQGQKRRTFIHAHPGIVQTNIYKTLPWYIRGVPKALSQVFGVSPETCAKNLLKGTYECAAADKEDKFWSCINEKGDVVLDKPVWSEEQIQRVRDHTWKIIDDALNASD
ncbi:uncharacterized protein NECHADRAFT_63193 [Fusarium vanettenii 77-13-4]|uniref:Uncharacterized protein n=1 Tax=Fusarium vanettenii (strain ATCC MYA-4622 / CBS 123669 / FGSC 9596 / NRRL 45880 / 77-13-4) TaxID=660122 RepID=C7Z025_FUSV7|nr:uncharacterized protein NECHADRAFT_63193 [Fusarium vanettenii 77-13-4]EEU42896.1 hypothetical protein NECHADRAFT_63193 [Fusarium vanettenii 77-13-4]